MKLERIAGVAAALLHLFGQYLAQFLSLSRQIMRQHQGTLTVKSTPGKGTEFFMRF